MRKTLAICLAFYLGVVPVVAKDKVDVGPQIAEGILLPGKRTVHLDDQ
jgi:hypothetical protein